VAQTPRQCLFCGATGVTKEHILPLWLGRVFDELAGPGGSVTFHHFSEHPEAGIEKRRKTAKRPAFHTRAFCRTCNGGWMARLEQTVQPVLKQLILGKPTKLSTDQQQLLAFWATKTVLAFYTNEHPTTSWARAGDYTNLYSAQVPLPCSQVWLGGNKNRLTAWYHAHRYPVPLHGHDPQEVHGYGASLALGHALFYVLVGYAGRVGMRLRYDAAITLKDIWPSAQAELAWPPHIAFPGDQPRAIPEFLAEHSIIRRGYAQQCKPPTHTTTG
jgi:hypothetical protein